MTDVPLCPATGRPSSIVLEDLPGDQWREQRRDVRFSSVESRLDILTGYVVEGDNRLTRVEEQLKHLRDSR